jgi:hypothetical protein
VIKFHGESTSGRHMLGIGLSRKNCEKLLAGQAIHFDLESMEGSGFPWKGEVLIVGGETEEDITMQMHDQGALDHARVFGFDESKEQR